MTKDIFSGRKVKNIRVVETGYQNILELRINELIAKGFVLVSEPLAQAQHNAKSTRYIAYLYEFDTPEVNL